MREITMLTKEQYIQYMKKDYEKRIADHNPVIIFKEMANDRNSALWNQYEIQKRRHLYRERDFEYVLVRISDYKTLVSFCSRDADSLAAIGRYIANDCSIPTSKTDEEYENDYILYQELVGLSQQYDTINHRIRELRDQYDIMNIDEDDYNNMMAPAECMLNGDEDDCDEDEGSYN
jgi:hypothetical protein